MALSSGQTVVVPFVDDKEKARLDKLKDALEKGSCIKCKMDDMTLIRFLRARNLDLPKTESMIKAVVVGVEGTMGRRIPRLGPYGRTNYRI